MFEVGESLRTYWLRQGIRLNPGTSEDELAAFEAKYDVRLPLDLRDYFSAANGFDASESLMTDDEVIAFLGLDEVQPLREYWSPEVADADAFFVFADYSLSAHVYAVRLSSELEHGNPVMVVYDGRLIQVACSFTEFVGGYLEKSEAVLFPESQA